MSNPFSELKGATSKDESKLTETNEASKVQTQQISTDGVRMNELIENVFYFTINTNVKDKQTKEYLLLNELSGITTQYMDIDLLEQLLFDRILLETPEKYAISKASNYYSEACEKQVVTYLKACYDRLRNLTCADEVRINIKQLIIRNVLFAVCQKDIFSSQDIIGQLLSVIKDITTPCEDFFIDISQSYTPEDDVTFSDLFKPLLERLHMEAGNATLVNLNMHIYSALRIFTSNEMYANTLLDHCQAKNAELGIEYANNLIGALLCISILPKSNNGRYDYFDKPLDPGSSLIESNLWTSVQSLNENLHQTFLRLLKCSKSVRNRTLIWIASCLKANASRGKLWNAHNADFNPMHLATVGDGFMINLANILLHLCQPFCSKIKDGKILKVDPTYCAVPDELRDEKEVHMFNLATETCLVPVETDDSSSATRPIAQKYNFVTECFYLSHRALDLSFRVCVDKIVQLNQEMGQIQRAYNDAISQANGVSDIIDSIKQRMDDGMTRYRSLHSTLLEPKQMAMLSEFHLATATWIVQVCLHTDIPENSSSYAPMTYRPIQFPLPNIIPSTLKCIPEFVIENTIGFLSFLRRFDTQVLENEGYQFLDPILTMVLVYMGSSQRMRNPHLRARMAECLEALLPYHKDVPPQMNTLKFQREQLFNHHPHRKQIVRCLLDVFVGIEMTGQSVEFEQKFNYRRPMYLIMDYLWQLDEHRTCFKQLAIEAEENMDAVSPPLFLRFINLLMNDAVFLLDESLSNMAQLRTMQTARENGDWNNLPPQERTQNFAEMQHTGMIARFDNILGRDTIHTLEFLTSEISTVFTHSTMVDRVAAMLNYFLLNLVGPNKKNFKVKDLKEYEFDPAIIVLDICKIYVHLKECDTFCLAVSQDGRSYSPQLFSLAEDVLARIGGGALISELQQVASKVSTLASKQETEEALLSEAPDEFLDPIMSTLMTDPVMLPSSKQIVDRTTIARHLLSDQTDPFNRSPLTMDQIIPNTELATKIKNWIAEKHGSTS